MTAHEGRTPSAWTVCDACRAVAPDRDAHQHWHAELTALIDALTDRLTAAETKLADLLGGTNLLADEGLL